jgi:hypothetical protein
MLIGLPKSIQLAGNYGQLSYQITSGSPSPSSDRGLRVNIEKIGQARTASGSRADRRPA